MCVKVGIEATKGFRSVWFSYLVVGCIERCCRCRRCVFQHSVVIGRQLGRRAVSHADHVPSSQTNVCMSWVSAALSPTGVKVEEKKEKKNRWNISKFLCYTGHCWWGEGEWAGPGGGRGRVAGEAVWWAGSGRKTTWHRASLHHFRWCVSDRMLANTCYQSGDGNRKLKECNVFKSHVCTSHSWIPLIKSGFTVLFPQAQFFGSVSAVKEKERGKKERETVI